MWLSKSWQNLKLWFYSGSHWGMGLILKKMLLKNFKLTISSMKNSKANIKQTPRCLLPLVLLNEVEFWTIWVWNGLTNNVAFFSMLNTTVLHNWCLVKSMDVELQMWRNYICEGLTVSYTQSFDCTGDQCLQTPGYPRISCINILSYLF